MEPNKYQAPAAEKVLEILELMANNNRSYTVTEIANELNFSANSVFRIFAEMERKQYVIKDVTNSSYELTPKIYYIGSSIKDRFNFVSTAKPYMKELSKLIGETVVLTILDENKRTFVVDQIESSNPIKCSSTIGLSYDSYISSMGKAMLANLSDVEIEDYLNTNDFAKKTESTITTKEAFRDELKITKETGIGYDREESIQGLVCCASPIFSAGRKLVGAIGITGLSFRISDTLEESALIIKEVAAKLSNALGYVE